MLKSISKFLFDLVQLYCRYGISSQIKFVSLTGKLFKHILSIHSSTTFMVKLLTTALEKTTQCLAKNQMTKCCFDVSNSVFLCWFSFVWFFLKRILKISILVNWSNAKTSPSIFWLKQVVHATVLPIEKQSLTAAIFRQFSCIFYTKFLFKIQSKYSMRFQLNCSTVQTNYCLFICVESHFSFFSLFFVQKRQK